MQPDPGTEAPDAQPFIQRWRAANGSERANYSSSSPNCARCSACRCGSRRETINATTPTSSRAAWPDLIVGLGIFVLNADAAREVLAAARREAALSRTAA